jgi:glycosyltransferase involved in cell wall biosynthesis
MHGRLLQPLQRNRMQVVHVITGMQVGGAEMLLSRIAPLQVQQGLDVSVVCLGPPGPISEKLTAAGVPLTHLGAKGMLHFPKALWQLYRLLKKQAPDVVHTWLYHADLLGGLASYLSGTPVLWSLHHAGVGKSELKRSTYRILKILAKLSHSVPASILSCAQVASRTHASIGYATEKLHFLPNGTDCSQFCPQPQLAAALRESLGISATDLVLGIAGRYHPLKDYPNFLAAVAILQEKMPHVHVLACGHGVDEANPALQPLSSTLPHPERLHLLGNQSQLAGFYSALDLFTLGEAMACGVPCVATDVGDCAFLLADTGLVAPAEDPQALAAAWVKLLSLSTDARHALGQAAQERIRSQFGIQESLDHLKSCYLRATAEKPQVTAPSPQTA